ncbi:MAG: hypothetical protein ABEJ23_00915 [Haloarculaceae archaeon]
MPTSVHQLDDGAWLSVNDERRISVSQLWLLADQSFCSCPVTDFLAEGFVEVGVGPPAVEARIAGRCIQCGQSGVTDWLVVGRVDPDDGSFRAVVPESVHLPPRS